MSKLNIKAYAAQDKATIELLDGQGEPLVTDDKQPVTVTIYGPGSKQYAAAQARVQNRAVDRLKAKGKADQSPEEKQRDTAEFLAAITDSFGNLDYDGKTGRDLSLAVYGDTTLGFIGEQVNKAAGDWAVFTKPSSKA